MAWSDPFFVGEVGAPGLIGHFFRFAPGLVVALWVGWPGSADARQVWRDLVAEANRAEMYQGGLFIDCGSADHAKYHRGGWRSEWRGARTTAGGRTVGLLGGRPTPLRLPPHPLFVQEVVVRVRSRVKGQTLTVKVDGRAIGPVPVGRQWKEARFPVDRPVASEVALVAGVWGEPSMEVDAVWLSEVPGAAMPDPVRVAAVNLAGRVRRGLLAAGRRYSHYVQIPPQASLSFAVGAKQRTRFRVHLTRDGADGAADRAVIFDKAVAGWHEARLNLGRYAGQTARLDFRSDGEGQAVWGALRVETAAVPERRRLPQPRHLVWVVADTMRADAMGVGGDLQVRTPAFDRLVREGVRFEWAYNNENWTLPSMATLFLGRYPNSHGIRSRRDRVPEGAQTLPRQLQAQGFHTYAVASNVFISKKYGFDAGFETFERGDDARVNFEKATAWVEKNRARAAQQRLFIYVHTMDAHTPYEVDESTLRRYHPEPYQGVLGDRVDAVQQHWINSGKLRIDAADRRQMLALYRGEVHQHDQEMARFLGALEAAGVLDDALVVFTNDHGEELGEHARYGHGWTVNEQLVRAPLVMRFPGGAHGGTTVREVVEHVDLPVTLLDLLRLEPLEGADGLSFRPLLEGSPRRPRPWTALIATRGHVPGQALRAGRWKCVRHNAQDGLFDVWADPGEQTNLATRRPIAARYCEVLKAEALAQPRKVARGTGSPSSARPLVRQRLELDEKTRQQLKSLGYLGDDEAAE